MKGTKTGGRKASTPNKATSSLHEQVEAEAGVPLPVLLTRIGIKAMKEGDHQLAVNALSKAAAYVYPRLQAALPVASDTVIYPPLVVDDDGKAKIPENWPGVVIRFTRQIKHMDGTTTTKEVGHEPTVSFTR